MIAKSFLFLVLFLLFNFVFSQKKERCEIPPEAPKRIEDVINRCQDEIKLQILLEALEALQINGNSQHRAKRQAFTEEDKRIAGCLLHCVYRKLKAVNEIGFPTTEGLVNLYTTGVTDKGYKIATFQAVHKCLSKSKKRYLIGLQTLGIQGKLCDVSYEVFDCIAEEIGEYCGQTP